MQKKESHAPTWEFGREALSIIFSGCSAVILMCLMGLLFASLMLCGTLSAAHIGLWAGITAFLSSLLGGVVIGRRGRILLFVLLTFLFVMVLLFLIGQFFLEGAFDPGSDPLMLAAVFAGLALGNTAVNLK